MVKFFATPGNSRPIFPPNQQFQATSVSIKKFLLISIHGIVFTGIVVAIIFEVADYKLEKRSHTGVYNDCHKIWSARGIYESRELQHSIQSINAAFGMDAKGAAVSQYPMGKSCTLPIGLGSFGPKRRVQEGTRRSPGISTRLYNLARHAAAALHR